MIPLASLPSRTPAHRLRGAVRDDPYWTSIWRPGSTGDWYSAADYRALHRGGFVTAPAWLDMSADDARTRVLAPRHRERVLRVLAALDQWRTMTVQQLEALTDVDCLTRGNASLLSALWNAGLVEICELGAVFKRGPRERDGILVRPARPGPVLAAFEASLTSVERISAHAGLGFDSDRQFTRHNILATEFALRAAEYTRVAMILGEKLSTLSLLAYAGVGQPVPSSGAAGSSDMTLVRPDGLRIAVEMTASLSGGAAGFYRKAERIVQILHRRPLAETGLMVLFVVAPRQDSTDSDPRRVLGQVKRAVQKAVHTYPGTVTDPTAARVAVASWAELFPADRVAHDDFMHLPVERPTGPGYRGDLDDPRVWEQARMLDAASTPFTPHDASALKAVVGNASGLRGVPHALRRPRNRPNLSDLSVRALGFDTIPQVEGTKPIDQGRGVSGVATIPERLRY